MTIEYRQDNDMSSGDFIDVLRRSGLAARRPVDDRGRIERMLRNSSLIVVASHAGRAIGVSRALTDFSYCCYLSDLAVDRAYQHQGIGKRLIDETRRLAGAESMCLLLAAPGASGFYEHIGMPRAENAFLYPRLA